MKKPKKSGITNSSWWVNAPGYEIVSRLSLRGQILVTLQEDPNGVQLERSSMDNEECPFATYGPNGEPLPWIVAKRLLKPIANASTWQAGSLQFDGVRDYKPMKVVGLHRVFAQQDGSEKSILAFASRYGFLGENTWLVELPFQGGTYFGEPCEYWQGQILRMRFLTKLFDLFRDPQTTEDELASMIKFTFGGVGVSETAAESMEPEFHSALGQSCYFKDVPPEIAGESLYRRGARTLLRSYVMVELAGGTVPVIDIGPGSHITLAPRTLVGAIYVQFAQELLGKSNPLIRCTACGGWFDSPHAGKLYCNGACKAKAYRQSKRKVNGD